ncbi:hypothetical protein OPV22_022811 [Ensete ventricosum]|uniref:EF-hand domain-containing protein n=1 Tax=Ensete ventricosum TaxID=4639 RepID=A0AAV8QQG2_ENSVE|nr:hypothetical protein OPV22_022811 [Ensete ventricosum]RWW34511.1 hypothetical protein GW17_00000713 [Ensete ventricosum]RWW63337.1 hypothetical protein BHE74_00029489 [Ensete ventricosum]RZR77779.1 hypothetical protein BHM03_00002969 [Ensete ventricosum]
MPAAVCQGLASSFSPSLGRFVPSIRGDQIHAIDARHHMAAGAAAEQPDLLAFQRCVADHFLDLADVDADGLLSLSWLRKLLHSFLVCHEAFRPLLLDRWSVIARPPLDRLVADFTDRAVKALDICNAARDGVDQLRRLGTHLEIVISALAPAVASPSRLGLREGQLRRARKALAELAVMLDDRDAGSVPSHRNRSLGRSGSAGSSSSSSPSGSRRLSHFRSLSSSVSRSWSLVRQLQAIGSNMAAPRGHEVEATAGLAVPIYTISAVLLFAMRSLVAAIPCHDRSIQAHLSIPRTFPWAAPIISIHERIVEESKKKERRNSTGLLKEIQQIERCTHQLTELTQANQFPMSEEKQEELRQRVEELAQVCVVLKEGLGPLECQVREVFLRIMCSRIEGLDRLSQTTQ